MYVFAFYCIIMVLYYVRRLDLHFDLHYINTSLLHGRGGAGIAQWLEHRTRDWKVAGSNPCWNGGRIFFSRVDFLCWLLFRYPFHPRVTTVAKKDPGHSAKSAGGMLQLNTHTPYVCGFAWSDMVHGCMVYTELAPRWLQFHVAPAKRLYKWSSINQSCIIYVFVGWQEEKKKGKKNLFVNPMTLWRWPYDMPDIFNFSSAMTRFLPAVYLEIDTLKF